MITTVAVASTGIGVFLVAFAALERVAPTHVMRQLGKGNPAVAVIVLSVVIGLGVVLSAAIPSNAP